ncbi:Protein kinase protein with adenine nucleotide alpha hydrolase-like domain [Forsythia ovata]|uniref:RING-type E3 ubiquitin transferase n=1 Tax=Forsythia ovata TaxID=205694 RepID=A0ABD1WYX6_9LAMI
MSQRGNNGDKKEEMVAVAIDKDKGSQSALKWAVDHLLGKGKRVTFLHVKQKASIASALGSQASFSDNDNVVKTYKGPMDSQTKEMFLPFRCFCTRKNIQVTEIVLEDTDIARALCDYVKNNLLEILVLGAPSRSSFVRFRSIDVPSSVSKMAPEFCTVYVVSKGKISNVRSASITLPNQLPRPLQNQTSLSLTLTDTRLSPSSTRGNYVDKAPFSPVTTMDDKDSIKSPFTRGKVSNRSFSDVSVPDSDISFVSSGRPSTDHTITSFDSQETNIVPRLSNSSDTDGRLSFGSPFSGSRSSDANSSFGVFSSSSVESGNFSWSGSQNLVRS